MKKPKKMMRYCKYCKKHTEALVSQAKKRERSSLKKYSLVRLKKRGSGKAGRGNRGKYSRKAISAWKRSGAKSSKKPDFRYTCTVCKKTTVQGKGKRTRKVEFI